MMSGHKTGATVCSGCHNHGNNQHTKVCGKISIKPLEGLLMYVMSSSLDLQKGLSKLDLSPFIRF